MSVLFLWKLDVREAGERLTAACAMQPCQPVHVHVCVRACMSVMSSCLSVIMYTYIHTRSPRAGVIGGCQLADMDAGK